MFQIKGRESKPKVSSSKTNEIPCKTNITHPVFCFRHVTTNKNYTFDHFRDKRSEMESRTALLVEIEKLSGFSWLDIQKWNKQQGYETIHFSQVNFNSSAELPIKKDEKVHVFRFDGKKARLIAFKAKDCHAIVHIIGYDFDFSAYSHGS